ncbi:helix-turn-helix domain-containing protein [Bdellovibrio sp. HCB2-146]|uniref:helix-turn-helix domain-containing protein n=1 Tax=Bdellovibrio sp. HCB2-146 TaxID=3394362 RepID=UPI0039BC381F
MSNILTFGTFGECIRSLRINAAKSMGQVARELGISTVYWSEVESGKKSAFPPGKVAMSLLAEVLGTSEELLRITAEADREKRKLTRAFECEAEYADLAVAFGRRINKKDLTEAQMIKIRDILNNKEG